MSATISGWVLVERPILDVFNYVTTTSRLCDWVPLWTKVESLDGETMKVGTAYDVDLAMPWELAMPWLPGAEATGADMFAPWAALLQASPLNRFTRDRVTVIDMVLGRSVTLRSEVIPQTATYTFEPSSRGTIVTADHDPWGFNAFNPWLGFAKPWLEGILKQTLVHLKRRLEAASHLKHNHPVFFSYRRKQDRYTGGRVVAALEAEFGQDAVFRDVDSLHVGDAQAEIERSIENCSLVVAFIGPGWFQGLREHEATKKKDWVRMELAQALKSGKTIIPILVVGALEEAKRILEEREGQSSRAGAAVASHAEGSDLTPRWIENPLDGIDVFIDALPDDLKKLGRSQIHLLRPDPDFRRDMEGVVKAAWAALPP